MEEEAFGWGVNGADRLSVVVHDWRLEVAATAVQVAAGAAAEIAAQ